jgi:hypothetical protein
MKWKFFKTNWFTIAVVLLLIAAIAQRRCSSFGGNKATSPAPKEQPAPNPEKYTAAEGESLLGFPAESPLASNQKQAPSKAAAIAFVRRFENAAISERKKFGIPASVILACAFVNSEAGKEDFVAKTNNFFALPCSPDWEGETKNVGGRCLRRYETPWASFRDFSIYLSGQEWFGSVKKSAGKDWQKWVSELAKRNISSVRDFEAEMKKAIQAHRLYDLDEL